MQKHKKIYLKELKYDEGDFIPCEVCRKGATDIHHIDARGMGGSYLKDFIQNLMALCRTCHDKYGDKEKYMAFLIDTHITFLKIKKVL